MMQSIRPFGQIQGSNTSNIAVTATSQPLAVPVAGIGVRSIRIANIGTQVIFLKFAAGTSAATVTTDMPMLANTVETFLLPNDIGSINVIAAATGSTMYLTVGESA